MDASAGGELGPMHAAARRSDRELVITRTINGPARLVFQAFTQAELFKRWWVPRSFDLTLLSCELDVRVGGTYRLVFQHDPEPLAFFGTYREVVPHSRLAWTNEEAGESGALTTVTFEERAGRTVVVFCDRYPSKEALDAAIASGATAGDMKETFDQLDELIGTLDSSSGPR